jgi:glutamate dehydrogenase
LDPRLIESVCDELARRVGPEEREHVVRFAQRFLSEVPADSFEGRDIEACAGLMLGAFRFLQGERSGDYAEVVEPEELERAVLRILRNWAERVREALAAGHPEADARALVERYGAAFSAEYRAAVEPAVAAEDVLELAAMAAEGRGIAVRLANVERAEWAAVDEPFTEVRLFLKGERFVLSNFMPILENAGLRVLAMSPFEVRGKDVADATICLFAVHDTAGGTIDLEARGALLAETILAVRAGDAMSDPLNALVIGAGLAWREVDLLRAYAEYAFQSGAVPARLSLPNALRSYPEAARLLVELFAAKFDPAHGEDRGARDARVAAARDAFLRALEQVSSLADDRALRRLLRLVDGTLRTNYYRHGGAQPSSPASSCAT